GAQERGGISDRPGAPAPGERNRQLARAPRHQAEQRPARFERGADVEKAQLVGACPAVGASLLYRVSGVAKLLEADALDHAAILHIQAGNDPPRQHAAPRSSAAWASRTENLPS